MHSLSAPLAFILVALTAKLLGQQHGVVVDQTGLPLPGARVEVHRGEQLVASAMTGLDGGFDLPEAQSTDTIDVLLDGFEPGHVPAANAQRIVLGLARATETTEVVASALTSAGASMEHLGSTMTAPLAQRLPASRPRILQSLPLLPAVFRGRDGLLRIGGTRPHESTLWIDGFDVTDPVSGTSSLDLPVESVRGIAVLREPVSAEFRDVLGSAASIETTPGSDRWRAGVQGFIPRPRLSHLGLGRIEAFFPRAYVGGRVGIVRLFASTEFNFERVPVPGVTGSHGRPNIGTTGVTSFGRIDVQHTTRHTITVETLSAPAKQTATALSSLRPEGTTPDTVVNDLFGSVTDRLVLTPRDLLTFRVGVIGHHTKVSAAGTGDALLTPEGWRQNWFSMVNVEGVRESTSVTWDRQGLHGAGAHSVSVNGGLRHRTLDGSLEDEPIRILDESGKLVKSVDFGATPRLVASDTTMGIGFRDLWDVTGRLQIDLGLRIDGGAASDKAVPGPRIGVRYTLDESGRTLVRGSAGRYVGRIPLGAEAFGLLPARTATIYDLVMHEPLSTITYQPSMALLPLPRADAYAIELEHHFSPTLEAQVSARHRNGSRLPTVVVPVGGGVVPLQGIGTSRYRELQVSGRKTWTNSSQFFVSYVWSSSVGDVNDFGSLFTNLDAPLLQPAGRASTLADVPHRLRSWATVSLPMRVVLSPAVEWRTGFPFSALNVYQQYAEPPNSERYPQYFAVDVTAFKTFDLFGRHMDLGLQLFNLTSYSNPRDVIAVIDSPRYRQFANTFGVTVAGYMQIRWQ